MDVGFLLWVLLLSRQYLSDTDYLTVCLSVSEALGQDYLGHDAAAFLACCGIGPGPAALEPGAEMLVQSAA